MSTCPRCWKQWENYLAVPAHHCEDGYLFLGERTVAIDPRVARLEAEVARLREALGNALHTLHNRDMNASMSAWDHLIAGNVKDAMDQIEEVAESIAASLAPAVAADGRRGRAGE